MSPGMAQNKTKQKKIKSTGWAGLRALLGGHLLALHVTNLDSFPASNIVHQALRDCFLSTEPGMTTECSRCGLNIPSSSNKEKLKPTGNRSWAFMITSDPLSCNPPTPPRVLPEGYTNGQG